MSENIPLFPLHTVLFPGASLALQVFEPRYLELVKLCLKKELPFGVVLIREGQETGPTPTFHNTGTLTMIQDFDRLDNGLLSIQCLGGRLFSVDHWRVATHQLLIAEIDTLPDPQPEQIPQQYHFLEPVLDLLMQHAGLPQPLPLYRREINWFSYRLAELLPFPLGFKQRLLETTDPHQRLHLLTSEYQRTH